MGNLGNAICLNQNDTIEFNVLIVGPSGSGKTRLLTSKVTGPTIKLERHLRKVSETHSLNCLDTPGILNLFKQQVNTDVVNSIDAIAYFQNSQPYKEHIQELFSGNSKLSRSVPQFDIPEDLKQEDILKKILLFIISSGKRKSKKPSYLQEVK